MFSRVLEVIVHVLVECMSYHSLLLVYESWAFRTSSILRMLLGVGEYGYALFFNAFVREHVHVAHKVS